MKRTPFILALIVLASACSQHGSSTEPAQAVPVTSVKSVEVAPAGPTKPAEGVPTPPKAPATAAKPIPATATYAPNAMPEEIPAKQTSGPVYAKIAELKLRNNPTTLHNGMEMIERLHAEEKLEAWAKGEAADPTAVLEFAARMTNVLERIKWTEHKKRERNPQEYDRIVKASLDNTRALPDFVKDAESFKKAADGLVQTCVDCHTLFK